MISFGQFDNSAAFAGDNSESNEKDDTNGEFSALLSSFYVPPPLHEPPILLEPVSGHEFDTVDMPIDVPPPPLDIKSGFTGANPLNAQSLFASLQNNQGMLPPLQKLQLPRATDQAPLLVKKIFSEKFFSVDKQPDPRASENLRLQLPEKVRQTTNENLFSNLKTDVETAVSNKPVAENLTVAEKPAAVAENLTVVGKPTAEAEFLAQIKPEGKPSIKPEKNVLPSNASVAGLETIFNIRLQPKNIVNFLAQTKNQPAPTIELPKSFPKFFQMITEAPREKAVPLNFLDRDLSQPEKINVSQIVEIKTDAISSFENPVIRQPMVSTVEIKTVETIQFQDFSQIDQVITPVEDAAQTGEISLPTEKTALSTEKIALPKIKAKADEKLDLPESLPFLKSASSEIEIKTVKDLPLSNFSQAKKVTAPVKDFGQTGKTVLPKTETNQVKTFSLENLGQTEKMAALPVQTKTGNGSASENLATEKSVAPKIETKIDEKFSLENSMNGETSPNLAQNLHLEKSLMKSLEQKQDPAPAAQLSEAINELSAKITQLREPQTIKLRLRPAELGMVEIKLDQSADGKINAHLTTHLESTKQILTENISDLRNSLQQAGWRINQLEVSCDPSSVNLSSNSNSNDQSQPQQTPTEQKRAFAQSFASQSEIEASPSSNQFVEDGRNRLLSVRA